MKSPMAFGLLALAFHLVSVPAAATCNPADPAYICGIEDAEDLVRLPGTPWVVASQLNLDLQSGMPPNPAGLGPLHTIKVDTHEVRRLYPTAESTVDWDRKTYPNCSAPPETPTSHGLNVRPLGGNKFRVYFTNHGSRQSVEVVDVAVQGDRPRATWRGCIPVPKELGIWPNSVVPLPDGGLVLSGSNMATWRPGGEWVKFEGYKGGKSGEPGSANGVEISRDGRSIFVAEPGLKSVTRIALSGDEQPASLKLSFGPDNLRWGEDGRLYAAGLLITEGFSLKECFAGPLCDVGFVIAQIDPATFTAKEVYRSGKYGMKGEFGSVTVALQVGKSLWAGTVHGDRVAVLPLKP